jgi:hypothetical protein
MAKKLLMAPARLVRSASLKRGYDIGLAATIGGCLDYEFPNVELPEDELEGIRISIKVVCDARRAHWSGIDGSLSGDEMFSATQLRLKRIREAVELGDVALPALLHLGWRLTVTTWEDQRAEADAPFSGVVKVKRCARSPARHAAKSSPTLARIGTFSAGRKE